MAEQAEMAALCDSCGAVIRDGSERYSVVPDSSVIHAVDPAFDGWRLVVACSQAHLQQLHEDYEKRPFVQAEQWAGKVQRAQRGGELEPWELRVLTELTDAQIRDGIEYARRTGTRWRWRR